MLELVRSFIAKKHKVEFSIQCELRDKNNKICERVTLTKLYNKFQYVPCVGDSIDFEGRKGIQRSTVIRKRILGPTWKAIKGIDFEVTLETDVYESCNQKGDLDDDDYGNWVNIFSAWEYVDFKLHGENYWQIIKRLGLTEE